MTVLGYLSILIVWALVSTAGLVTSVVLTNPLTIGPAGVTAWFVVMFLDLAALMTVGLYTLKTFLHVHAAGVNRLRYSWRQGLLIGGWLTGLLALGSLHQLGVLDAILLALMLVILEGYVRLRWP